MTNISLNRQEKNRLHGIADNLGWRFSVSVKEHFNKVGKLEDFSKAATQSEKDAQAQCLAKIFQASSNVEADFYALKNLDIFCVAARRAGNDNDLAALLPKGKFDEHDVAVLEKCQFSALLALTKQSLK